MSPGCWLGEGKIRLNMAEDEMSFFMRWNIAPSDGLEPIECVQEIQVVGLSEIMHNEFAFFLQTGGAIDVELDNQTLGIIGGNGFIDPQKIAWEFERPDVGFSGYEFYQKYENDYLMHAEYATVDNFRTQIRGRIWKQGEESQ